mmetsp:Transcript_17401/g.42228  ORF Transcript_17401/g.42228 Transcript_17401/m.42228 type:complete len:289 (+) Transcript_17401:119-985(+)
MQPRREVLGRIGVCSGVQLTHGEVLTSSSLGSHGVLVDVNCLLLGLGEVLVDKVPVDKLVEEGGHVGGAHVLVVDIVGVLPHVHGQDRRLAVSQGVARADGLVDRELGAIPAEPRPAGAERGVASDVKLLLELVIRPKVLVNLGRDVAGGRAAAVGLHAVPVERVVPGLSGVVEQAHVVVLVRLHEDGLGVVSLHLGALDHLVGDVDVLGVVLVVVDGEGSLGDLRLKRGVVVGEGRELDLHRHTGGRGGLTLAEGKAAAEERRREGIRSHGEGGQHSVLGEHCVSDA